MSTNKRYDIEEVTALAIKSSEGFIERIYGDFLRIRRLRRHALSGDTDPIEHTKSDIFNEAVHKFELANAAMAEMKRLPAAMANLTVLLKELVVRLGLEMTECREHMERVIPSYIIDEVDKKEEEYKEND